MFYKQDLQSFEVLTEQESDWNNPFLNFVIKNKSHWILDEKIQALKTKITFNEENNVKVNIL